MIVAGMDIGSITTETVILQDNQILASIILPTGANSRRAAERSLAAALEQARIRQEDLSRHRHYRIWKGFFLSRK